MISFIYHAVLITGILVGIFHFKKLSIAFKMLTVVLLYTTIHEISIHNLNFSIELNYLLYNIYAIFSCLTYLLVIRFQLQERKFQIISNWLIILAVFVDVLILLGSDLRHNFPSRIIAFTFPIVILSSILLFWQLLNSNIETKLAKRSSFWLATGILIYHSIGYAILGLFSYALELNLNYGVEAQLMFYISIIFYSMIGYSIYLNGNRE